MLELLYYLVASFIVTVFVGGLALYAVDHAVRYVVRLVEQRDEARR